MLPEEQGRRPYALLTKALEESEFVAMAKLTMRQIASTRYFCVGTKAD